MAKFLDGCGVEYVHWLPKPAPTAKPMPIRETPLIAANDVGSSRIRRAIVRYQIESWQQLTAVDREEFHKWKNYGKSSHAKLVALALANGYSIDTWD